MSSSVIGIRAAGAGAVGAVADGFAAVIAVGGAVAAADGGQPGGVADRVGGSVRVGAAFGIAVARGRGVGQCKGARQAGEGVGNVGGFLAGSGIANGPAFAHGIVIGAGIAAAAAVARVVGHAVIGVILVIDVREAIRCASGDGEGDATGKRAVFAGAIRIGAAIRFVISITARLT